MRKNSADGLILRKDGRYQRKEMIGEKWKTFSGKTPADVWGKIRAAQDKQAELERQQEERQNAGELFAVIADEYRAIVEGMKEGTKRSYLPAVARAKEAFGEYRMREIQPYMIAEFLRGPEMEGRAATTVSNQKLLSTTSISIG